MELGENFVQEAISMWSFASLADETDDNTVDYVIHPV